MQLADLHLEQQDVNPKFDVETDILMLLYTRNNPSAGQRLFNNADSVRNSNFNPNWPVRILVHGWTGSQTSPSIVGPKDAYMQHGDFNVIGVDWAEGAQTINYITARNRVSDVGAFVARFIDFLHAEGFTQFHQVQVMGHSLGAHVAGICGKKVTRGRVQTVCFKNYKK